MHWEKHGLIFKLPENHSWIFSHSQVPFAIPLSEETIRIYFNVRDVHNRTHPIYIEVDAREPFRIKKTVDSPIIGLGSNGAFDDRGVMCSWIIQNGAVWWMYYVGWTFSHETPYRLSIGLAESTDSGRSFKRVSLKPLRFKTTQENASVSLPCVLYLEGRWRAWYMEFTEWVRVQERMEPKYIIKHLTSPDGIVWEKESVTCIDFASKAEGGIARPMVQYIDGHFTMWYCYRGLEDYRTKKASSYRLGVAHSKDGQTWIRDDKHCGITRSKSGWDSQMIAYPFVFQQGESTYMLYNGNGFGQNGFGYAKLIS